MNYKKNIIKAILVCSTASVLMTGCSLKNTFGIGYDTSVCEASKDFGVCGAPKDIYQYRDKIRKVQSDYLHAGLDVVLYFGINNTGNIVVKKDRDDSWSRYDISPWRTLINEKNIENQEIVDEQDRKSVKVDQELNGSNVYLTEEESGKGYVANTRSVRAVSYQNDLPVTENSDLSVKYSRQGPLLVTRSKVGDIIRDNGLMQQIFVANYVDTGGDLVSSHELFIVVNDPKWIVGEATPKSTKLNELPTPVSERLLYKQNRTNSYQERVIDSYNSDNTKGVINANIDNPSKVQAEEESNMDLINSFLKEK